MSSARRPTMAKRGHFRMTRIVTADHPGDAKRWKIPEPDSLEEMYASDRWRADRTPHDSGKVEGHGDHYIGIVTCNGCERMWLSCHWIGANAWYDSIERNHPVNCYRCTKRCDVNWLGTIDGYMYLKPMPVWPVIDHKMELTAKLRNIERGDGGTIGELIQWVEDNT